ncbi:MAG: DNA polymerase III subunit gamma/tau [Candidatus Omnitrophota bacterium]
MSHISFARKYRPQIFDEIIGQDHVVTTLKNAITMKRVAHAYIFSGPRGVGKTTTARILSKSLNCAKGPTVTPCNTCPSCKEITLGSGIDVLEIDGASNRGIDEIRSLRDSVKFSPGSGAYRIYIIDEAHMLTPEAFNALLKTLEEPPPHVIFIFATTRPLKIPLTILSRCQRLDFRRITTPVLIAALEKIAKSERLKVSDGALELVARYADGCMRDAEVLLDQLATFADGSVEADDVAKMVGLVPEDVLFALADTVSGADPASALSMIDQAVNDGKEAAQILIGLIGHFRDLAVFVVSNGSGAGTVHSEHKASRLKEQAKNFSIETILYAMYTLSNAMDLMKKTQLVRVPLEMAMVKLCRKSGIRSLDEIMERIRELETKIAAPSDPFTPSPGPRPVRQPENRAERSDAPRSREAPPDPDEIDEEYENTADEIEPSVRENMISREAPASGGDVAAVAGVWQRILKHIGAKKISVASFLAHGRPVKLESGKLTIGLPKNSKFHKKMLEEPESRSVIESSVLEVMGKTLKISFVVAENVEAPDARPEGVRGADTHASSGGNSGYRSTAVSEPIVKDAMEIFGGEVVGLSRINPKERPK